MATEVRSIASMRAISSTRRCLVSRECLMGGDGVEGGGDGVEIGGDEEEGGAVDVANRDEEVCMESGGGVLVVDGVVIGEAVDVVVVVVHDLRVVGVYDVEYMVDVRHLEDIVDVVRTFDQSSGVLVVVDVVIVVIGVDVTDVLSIVEVDDIDDGLRIVKEDDELVGLDLSH